MILLELFTFPHRCLFQKSSWNMTMRLFAKQANSIWCCCSPSWALRHSTVGKVASDGCVGFGYCCTGNAAMWAKQGTVYKKNEWASCRVQPLATTPALSKQQCPGRIKIEREKEDAKGYGRFTQSQPLKKLCVVFFPVVLFALLILAVLVELGPTAAGIWGKPGTGMRWAAPNAALGGRFLPEL